MILLDLLSSSYSLACSNGSMYSLISLSFSSTGLYQITAESAI